MRLFTGYLGSLTSLLLLAFVSCLTGIAGADDCEKARGIYKQAIDLMNYEDRRGAFQRAVDLCPSYAEAHVNLADAFENLGKFDDAERHYLEAIRIRPGYYIPYIGLGEVYLKTGRFGLAKEAFVEGLAIRPDHERLQAGLKVVQERLKREKSLFTAAEIEACLTEDERFRLMCMCPTDDYEYLKKWICIPPVFFATGASYLSGNARRQLDHIGKALASETLTGKKWLIVGHADNIGDLKYNRKLSQRRAEAVKRYLVSRHGLSPESMRIKFFGQGFPRASNTSSGGRSENRRVEIVADLTVE
jgi:outer membrane protein OmpA-like peptidoglycan-associated protein